MKLVACSMTNAKVVKELFISPNIVNKYLNSIYSKIGASSHTVATRFAMEHHLH